MEFEKYLTQIYTTNVGLNHVNIPAYEYIIMQFLDFSYHENTRCYFFDDPDYDIDTSKPVGTTLYKNRVDSYYRFSDFIKTFRLMFDV